MVGLVHLESGFILDRDCASPRGRPCRTAGRSGRGHCRRLRWSQKVGVRVNRPCLRARLARRVPEGKDADALLDRVFALDEDEAPLGKDAFARNGIVEVETNGAVGVFELVPAIGRGAEHAKEEKAMPLPSEQVLGRGELHESVRARVARRRGGRWNRKRRAEVFVSRDDALQNVISLAWEHGSGRGGRKDGGWQCRRFEHFADRIKGEFGLREGRVDAKVAVWVGQLSVCQLVRMPMNAVARCRRAGNTTLSRMSGRVCHDESRVDLFECCCGNDVGRTRVVAILPRTSAVAGRRAASRGRWSVRIDVGLSLDDALSERIDRFFPLERLFQQSMLGERRRDKGDGRRVKLQRMFGGKHAQNGTPQLWRWHDRCIAGHCCVYGGVERRV